MIKLNDPIRNVYKKRDPLADPLFNKEFSKMRPSAISANGRAPKRLSKRFFLLTIAVALSFGLNLFLFILLKSEISQTNTMIMILASRSKKMEGSVKGSTKSISDIYTDAEIMKEKIETINYKMEDIDEVKGVLNDIISTINNMSLNEQILDKKLRITMLRVSSINKTLKKLSGDSISYGNTMEKANHVIGILAHRLSSINSDLYDLKNSHQRMKARIERASQNAVSGAAQHAIP